MGNRELGAGRGGGGTQVSNHGGAEAYRKLTAEAQRNSWNGVTNDHPIRKKPEFTAEGTEGTEKNHATEGLTQRRREIPGMERRTITQFEKNQNSPQRAQRAQRKTTQAEAHRRGAENTENTPPLQPRFKATQPPNWRRKAAATNRKPTEDSPRRAQRKTTQAEVHRRGHGECREHRAPTTKIQSNPKPRMAA